MKSLWLFLQKNILGNLLIQNDLFLPVKNMSGYFREFLIQIESTKLIKMLLRKLLEKWIGHITL